MEGGEEHVLDGGADELQEKPVEEGGTDEAPTEIVNKSTIHQAEDAGCFVARRYAARGVGGFFLSSCLRSANRLACPGNLHEGRTEIRQAR